VPDVDELTRELDLDAALARTYEIHDGLRRRATARRRWATGGGLLAAAAIAAALIVPAIGSDGAQPTKSPAPAAGPAATTTTAGPEGGVPAGYALTTEGDVLVLHQVEPSVTTTTTTPGGAVVGIGDAAAVQRGTIASASVSASGRTAVVGFDCVAADQVVDAVRYRVEPARIVVDAELSFDPASAACLPSSPETVIQLPLPVAVAPGTPIVAEPLHTP
jgi:hypothetical protein